MNIPDCDKTGTSVWELSDPYDSDFLLRVQFLSPTAVATKSRLVKRGRAVIHSLEFTISTDGVRITTMAKLGVNIDHVATVRQARKTYEPDPIWAAVEAQLGGADGITVHLREDRRHIQDRDVEILRQMVSVPLNLEMAATDEIVSIALRIKPAMAMLVPEKRTEVTTEGGLDVAGQQARITEVVKRLAGGGMKVSAFIDAEERQIAAAHAAGFSVCEIHTGPYSYASDRDRPAQLEIVRRAGVMVMQRGMQLNAGHGLNYVNVAPIAALPGISELHIGHAIVSRAIFVGMREAVREMKRLIA
jgi:pyridoxine 5-phosphate synthase